MLLIMANGPMAAEVAALSDGPLITVDTPFRAFTIGNAGPAAATGGPMCAGL
jgi:hypothetical protein